MTDAVRKAGLRPLDLYVGVMAAIGAAIVGVVGCSAAADPACVASGCCSAALALVAGRFPLRIPGLNATFSVSDTFFITSALLFGPAPATVTVAIDSLVMSYGRQAITRADGSCSTAARRRSRSGSARRCSFWLVGLRPALRAPMSTPISMVLPLAASATVYYLLNSGLTAIAVALEKSTVARRRVAIAFRHGLPELLRRRRRPRSF